MCILYCCEGRKLDNYWAITSPSLNKEYCIVLYCIGTCVRGAQCIKVGNGPLKSLCCKVIGNLHDGVTLLYYTIPESFSFFFHN